MSFFIQRVYLLDVCTLAVIIIDFLNCIPGADANGLTEVKRRVHAIVVRIDPRTTNGDSLLHMACMRKNKLRDQQLFEESTVNFFPSPSVVRLLVECGAKVNSTNALANTPLHTASVACNFNQDVSYLPQLSNL